MPDDRSPDFRTPEFLLGHIRHTLAFYASRALDPSGGFFHFFKDDGTVYDAHTRHLVSSTRFVFNHAMAFRRFGRPQDQAAARHGLRFLQTAHALPEGGYAWLLDWREGRATVLDATRHAYGQAFVLLAHAHALMAGLPEAAEGLEAAWSLMDARFWEHDAQLHADEATAGQWAAGELSPYRGQNANMHACEAMLAAYEATQDPKYLERSLTLARRVTQDLAALAGGLVWEHYRRGERGWEVDWGYNRDDKSNIFRPWGYQTGHLTEWAKLLLQLERHAPQDWMLPTARRFFDTAWREGWDGLHGGLVYGFAPGGSALDGPYEVCDADKYFWVQAESLAAAALLACRTGEDPYWQAYEQIWSYAWSHFIDHAHGAWYRILGPDNRKLTDEKSPAGKTDYHTMGACYDVLRAMGA